MTAPAHLELARAELAAGVRESALNDGERIRMYLEGCVRDGKRLGVLRVPWCAAMASWCVWQAFARAQGWGVWPLNEGLIDQWARSYDTAPRDPDDPPIGYRAAVHELVTDARATGTLRDASATPAPGWLAIYRRGHGDPMRGGEGHVEIVESVDADGGTFAAIGGNVGDRVARVTHALGDFVAWIEIG